MEREFLNAYNHYLAPYYGVANENMKKTLSNVAAIVKELGFLMLNVNAEEGKGTIEIKLMDPIEKGTSNKTCGSISISSDSAVITYDEQTMHDGIPHDSYCTIGVQGDNIVGTIQKPTKDFEEHVITNFVAEGILITNAEGKKEAVPYLSDTAPAKLKEVYRAEAFRLDAVNATKTLSAKKHM